MGHNCIQLVQPHRGGRQSVRHRDVHGSREGGRRHRRGVVDGDERDGHQVRLCGVRGACRVHRGDGVREHVRAPQKQLGRRGVERYKLLTRLKAKA
jgi:hypothetical protein